jgi:hypothetical protein
MIFKLTVDHVTVDGPEKVMLIFAVENRVRKANFP